MRDQEIIGLYEAYQQVCESSSITSEEVQSLDESDLQQKVGKALDAAAKNPVVQAIGKVIGPVNKGRRTPTATSGGYRPEEVEIDLFDTILEHLVAEGYADTNEAALVIMANMSEEWRQSIVEGVSERGQELAHRTGQAADRALSRTTDPKKRAALHGLSHAAANRSLGGEYPDTPDMMVGGKSVRKVHDVRRGGTGEGDPDSDRSPRGGVNNRTARRRTGRR